MARKPTDIVPIQVRMREGLRRKLEQATTKNDQSLNSEMVARLEASFDEESNAAIFRGAMGTLSGGEENAKLLGLIASALHLVTIQSRGLSVEDRMERFANAAQGIMAGFIGRPQKLYTYEQLQKMDANMRFGAVCADVVLRSEGFPGFIEEQASEATSPFARLMMSAEK